MMAAADDDELMTIAQSGTDLEHFGGGGATHWNQRRI